MGALDYLKARYWIR